MRTAYPVLALCAFGAVANAQSGGFTGPDGRELVSVAEAATLPDDTDVRLAGYIVESLGDEKYRFQDDSGSIIVEIDDDDWDGLEVSPGDRVEIAGEVEQEKRGAEIDVDTVRLAN